MDVISKDARDFLLSIINDLRYANGVTDVSPISDNNIYSFYGLVLISTEGGIVLDKAPLFDERRYDFVIANAYPDPIFDPRIADNVNMQINGLKRLTLNQYAGFLQGFLDNLRTMAMTGELSFFNQYFLVLGWGYRNI